MWQLSSIRRAFSIASASLGEGLTGPQKKWKAYELTQRAQYHLIKEYTLNHNIKAPSFKVYSFIKGVLGSLGKV